MSSRPELVSVIITCFNFERYVGVAIESVLRQDYASRLEVIVVDDCSTDGSAEIIQSYEKAKYRRTAQNGGVLLAMLDGIDASTGDIVMFLDGDDLWDPDKVSAVAGCFAANPGLALVTHDLRFVDQDGNPLPRTTRSEEELRASNADESNARLLEGILTMDDYVWLGSAFAIRRRLGRLEEFATWAQSLPDPANTYQDWPLAFWIASLPGTRLGYVDRKLFSYRLHGSNYSGDARTGARAARNFDRSYNTVAAMAGLARDRRLPRAIVRSVEQRANAYRYLAELHRGDRWAAMRRFASALPDFVRRRLVGKELMRFAGVQLLGPDRFASLAAGRRIMRTTRVS